MEDYVETREDVIYHLKSTLRGVRAMYRSGATGAMDYTKPVEYIPFMLRKHGITVYEIGSSKTEQRKFAKAAQPFWTAMARECLAECRSGDLGDVFHLGLATDQSRGGRPTFKQLGFSAEEVERYVQTKFEQNRARVLALLERCRAGETFEVARLIDLWDESKYGHVGYADAGTTEEEVMGFYKLDFAEEAKRKMEDLRRSLNRDTWLEISQIREEFELDPEDFGSTWEEIRSLGDETDRRQREQARRRW